MLVKPSFLILTLFTALIIIIFFCYYESKLNSKNNQGGHFIASSQYSEKDLKMEFLDTSQHNALSEMCAINDTATAINVAESILFGIYGKENIIDERPYQLQQIKGYYVISGTLPKRSEGGVFLIVIDSRTSKVIRITHGK